MQSFRLTAQVAAPPAATCSPAGRASVPALLPRRTPLRTAGDGIGSEKLTRPQPRLVCHCHAAQQPLPDGLDAAAPMDARRQEAAAEAEEDDMAQYAQLKADMNRTTRRFAAFISGYLLLTSTSDVALCAAAGSAVGYGYLQLLMRDVDAFRQDDPVAAVFLMQEDSGLELAALRSARKIAAAFRAALRPRLLVLVGLAAGAAAFNAVAHEPLNGMQSAALFGGFLTYKAGQLGQVWEAVRPKFDPAALDKPPTPQVLTAEELEAAADREVDLYRQRVEGKGRLW